MKNEKEIETSISQAYYYAIANFLFNKGKIDAATLQKKKKKIESSN